MTVRQWPNSLEKPKVPPPVSPQGDISIRLARFDAEANKVPSLHGHRVPGLRRHGGAQDS